MAFAQQEIASLGLPPQEFSAPESLPLIECLIEPDSPHIYEYALQNRIAHEWRPLIGTEGNPASRHAVYEKRFGVLTGIMDDLSTAQRDGGMSTDLRNLVVRQGSYAKNIAIDLGTSFGIDLQKIIEDKLFGKMQRRYDPNAVTELRILGYSNIEAMALLKSLDSNGKRYVMKGIVPSDVEERQRLPRQVPLSDPVQDMVDAFKRRASGSDLRASDEYKNLRDEMQELRDEFKGMDESEIRGLNRHEHAKKLLSIGGEIADVIIGWDGYAAAIDSDQGVEANVALNRAIYKYHKVQELIERGVEPEEAMNFIEACWEAHESGQELPAPPIPGFVIPFVDSRRPQLGYA